MLLTPAPEWSIDSTVFPVPSNAREVVVTGRFLSDPIEAPNVLKFRVTTNGTDTVLNFTACVSSRRQVVDGSAALACELDTSVNLTSFISKLASIEVTRGYVTQEAAVGFIAPPMIFSGRPGARVSAHSTHVLLQGPFGRGDFLAAYGSLALDLKLITANLSVSNSTTGKRAAAVAEASCSVGQFFGQSLLQCDLAAEVEWSAGNMTALISMPLFGISQQVYIGEVLTGLLAVNEARGGKFAIAAGTTITVTGANFAGGSFAKSDNQVIVSIASGRVLSNCTILSASSSSLSCSFASSALVASGESVLVQVTSWGATSNFVVIGSVVPLPVISVSDDKLSAGNTKIVINGSNLADNVLDNRVRAYKGSPGSSSPDYTSCDIVAAESSTNAIVCILANSSVIANTGDRLTVSVYSNGAWSTDYTAIIGGAIIINTTTPTAPTFVPAPGQSSIDNTSNSTGLAIGLSLAAVAIIAAIILGLVLFRRQRHLKDIKGEMHKVPAAFASMFNVKTADLTIVKKLGEGSFGAVFLATFKTGGGLKNVAVKKLTSSMLAASVDGFFREAVRTVPL